MICSSPERTSFLCKATATCHTIWSSRPMAAAPAPSAALSCCTSTTRLRLRLAAASSALQPGRALPSWLTARPAESRCGPTSSSRSSQGRSPGGRKVEPSSRSIASRCPSCLRCSCALVTLWTGDALWLPATGQEDTGACLQRSATPRSSSLQCVQTFLWTRPISKTLPVQQGIMSTDSQQGGAGSPRPSLSSQPRLEPSRRW
mmetsp:Transcript_103536/g.288290  ORF Transcript_103536/g.288290 Transcript_103536/m.288290 type:complete len:203 (-) Transcript_103536:843-1451(-)